MIRSKTQPPGTSVNTPKAIAAVSTKTPSRISPIRGSVFFVIL